MIVTAYDTDDDIGQTLSAVAKAYLLEDIEPRALVPFVHADARGTHDARTD
jgi:DNA-binding NarL/FixJ family response regulator